MEIVVINPTITTRWAEATQRTYEDAARPSTIIRVVTLDWGTASIECYRDTALVVPDILTKTVQAAQAGADAVIIDCMDDPGLYAARELVTIPVVGPAQSSMHLAAMLGHRFSVLTTAEQDIAAVAEKAARYGLAPKLASARSFGIPVLALDDDRAETLRLVIEVAEQAVREDGAHVLIPGCTGLAGLAGRIQAGLADRDCEVPVLDPPSVALKMAESLVDLGQTHSRRTYPSPPIKEIRWPAEGTFGA
jgi:allantoin racemase